MFEFDRYLEARRAVARRSVAACVVLSLAGALPALLAAASLRSSVLAGWWSLVALLLGGLTAGAGAAGAGFFVATEWAFLPWRSRLVGVMPWAVVCLLASFALRGYFR